MNFCRLIFKRISFIKLNFIKKRGNCQIDGFLVMNSILDFENIKDYIFRPCDADVLREKEVYEVSL